MAAQTLDGKVAIITGASSGIGAGTAVLFSKLGAQLALTGRNESNLSKVGEDCEKNSGKKPLIIVGDVTVEKDVECIVSETVKHFGKINILVNNAGVGEMGTIENTSLEQFDRVFNVNVNNAGVAEMGTIENTSMEQFDRVFNMNVRSIYQLTMLCTPHLVETKGSIVNVSSVNGIRAFQNVLAYCMSKASVDQMTRCVALELASKGVRCNSVNPGVIITDIHRRAGLTEEQYAAFLERSKETHALGRPGEVEEVAKSIAFLASDDSSFITGTSLPIDGGRHAMCPR